MYAIVWLIGGETMAPDKSLTVAGVIKPPAAATATIPTQGGALRTQARSITGGGLHAQARSIKHSHKTLWLLAASAFTLVVAIAYLVPNRPNLLAGFSLRQIIYLECVFFFAGMMSGLS